MMPVKPPNDSIYSVNKIAIGKRDGISIDLWQPLCGAGNLHQTWLVLLNAPNAPLNKLFYRVVGIRFSDLESYEIAETFVQSAPFAVVLITRWDRDVLMTRPCKKAARWHVVARCSRFSAIRAELPIAVLPFPPGFPHLQRL